MQKKPKTKIAIGCLIQWYEVDIIESYLSTLREAITVFDSEHKNEGRVHVDLCVCSDTSLEKCVSTEVLNQSVNRIVELADRYDFEICVINDLYTIADYRREFNTMYCDSHDVLVWGESDMLVPVTMFSSIHSLHQTVSDQTPKYIATFASCKMWDASWAPLEHPSFNLKKHSDDPKDWWSVRYTNTVEDMERINNLHETTDIETIQPFKFNGCGLVISSEIVKAGANIPKAVFFVHEDTAFLLALSKCIPDATQYHFKHIYLPHNRKHPNKRANILGEEGIDKNNIGLLRKSHWWYPIANQYSELNCYNLYTPNYRFKTWKDVFAQNPENKK